MNGATYWKRRVGAMLAVLLLAGSARAQSSDRPQRFEADPEARLADQVKVVEHTGQRIPLDLAFTDEAGRTVRLGDYFDGRRPVLLVPVYYRCPMLCGLVLNALSQSLGKMSWTIGEKFQVVVFSFDPNETVDLAAQKKKGYLAQYNRPGAAAGWHFLVGSPQSIERLTEAIGFGYTWDRQSRQYVHKATVLVMTPDGHISRYLYDVRFPPRTLRLSLVEASDGKVGSTIDRFVLSCFHYDPASETYAAQAMGLMRLGGVATIVLLVLIVGLWRMRGRRRRKATATAGA